MNGDTAHPDSGGENGAPPAISIVVPCYREEDVLPLTISALADFLAQCVKEGVAAPDSEIIFVDDGSPDRTWECIEAAYRESSVIKGIRLSRNQGHQQALLAGLEAARGDFVISIDADLQDDVSVMRDMILLAMDGNDIVYGVRASRASDTLFKRLTAESFYRIMRLLGVDLVFNHADFRGMSRKALRALFRYREKSLFLRGLVGQLGFKTAKVFYDRKERQAGTTKYPLRKMISFALHGVTSFSFVPLRMVSMLGLMLSALSVALIAWIVYTKFTSDHAVPGWASTLVIQSVFGGIQLLCLGVIGEYLVVIFKEVKDRPAFHIAETVGDVASRAGDARED